MLALLTSGMSSTLALYPLIYKVRVTIVVAQRVFVKINELVHKVSQ